LTLKEVGGHLGVSGERARQIIWQGLDEVYAQIRDLTRLPRKGSL
jgi:DNA-directed RNA polymerase sigma subunit (sigma70/sigma32)